MEKFGLVIAVFSEIKALLDEKGATLNHIEEKPFNIYEYKIKDNKILYIIHSGCGEEFASIATTYLILKYKVTTIFNYGVVGALNPNLKECDTCLINEVIQHDFDTDDIDHKGVGYHSEFETNTFNCDNELIKKSLKIVDLPIYRLCSGNRFISSEKDRKYLFNTFKGDVCDMELVGILMTAKLFNIPVLSIKGVSDSYHANVQDFETLAYKSASIAVKIILNIVENI